MAATNNPLEQSSAAFPAVSCMTLPIAGLKVDIYGLSELPATANKVSCLWLHHPRLCRKEDMADITNQIFHAHMQRQLSTRGLIAVAFDQRNHGSRLVDGLANEAWRSGNKTHAQDMFGTITGTVSDTIHLLDALEGYLFGAGHGHGAMPDGGKRYIDHNMVLGVSLGGHTAWQTLFAEPRVTAGVIVIGCPDYMYLMKDRARLSRLQTFSAEDNGASFLGSKDFPDALVNACKKCDPKGMLFGTDQVASPVSAADQERLRPLLDRKISGKRFQILSGGVDKLVPYSAGAPFLGFFKEAVNTWYKDGGVYVEDKIYPSAGHEFNFEMKGDAVRFVLDSMALADSEKKAAPKI
ncbi:Alpha/Beta hydrolase protein [Hypoxylon crocopeplum]|nr:Alpha/Beta hydrolase protein [Hypoxylon crocopeplum]